MTPTAEGVLARWTAGPGDQLDADAALAVAQQLNPGPVREAIETAARARRQMQEQHTRDLYAPYVPSVPVTKQDTVQVTDIQMGPDPARLEQERRAIIEHHRRRRP